MGGVPVRAARGRDGRRTARRRRDLGDAARLRPLRRPLFNESLLLLQAFQGVSAVITLVLAAAVAERTEAVDRLRRLAVSDPLTGLSNYRQLAHALDAEIRRSSRTDRPFAVV